MVDARIIPLRRHEDGRGSGQADKARGEWVLFACSSSNLSKGGFQRLEAICAAATERPHMLIRLEDMGQSLFEAMDEMRRGGAGTIRLQPIGLPFPESLLSWLPGVLAHWKSRPVNAGISVSLGPEPSRAASGPAGMLRELLDAPSASLAGVPPALGKPGWDSPPDFDFHLLVCTGPRCQMRDAASLSHVLKAECAAAGIAKRCLTTTTGCIYPCNKGPVVAVYPQGDWFRVPDRTAARRLVHEVLCAGRNLPDLQFHSARRARADH
ncbi:(2Fe-2S) ferredoxin domain-containing protein [Salipiger mucosus]|uniref:Uncharacterized protein n=1 Tax=Salipiger mucosus DSM 16094 TaxID=1123237 RepID=S9QB85_9RHOB|nr:(2Fe-2S) ferredoxin domain-containing protein [Salipiger mucosus]EPX78641.1 hypothetical protein Salmuc_04222 [Salipiger mucosus DSM 16094]